MTKHLIIDGTAVEVEDHLTLMQACEQAGAEIPRFCYHERLSIAGNCRMCLVEVQGSPKPIASCAMGVADLPPNRDGSAKVINTNTPLVKKAREGVMEFLLINHPLDCPICDQGGECDLQDQAMAFGVGGSRYRENKRAVEEKNIGPLIKTVMTRCIHCTRCVRYMTEVAGVEELGLTGRGEDAEIMTYLENGILSEMSANVVDLCPVGALTHRPWAHNTRPWELDKTETIDVMDAVGSAIRVDTRGSGVMRILPRNNDAVNEEWISDKSRHVADGLRTQRLDRPYIRSNGRLQPATWPEVLALVGDRLKTTAPERIGAIAGDLAGAEEMFALKDLLGRLGVKNYDCRQAGEKLDPKLGRASYLFNSSIAGIEDADVILLIGTNPRIDAPVLNARIRKRWRRGGLTVFGIGSPTDLSYSVQQLGPDTAILAGLVAGMGAAADALSSAKRPMVIVGEPAVSRDDGLALLSAAARLASGPGIDSGWNGFNILHTAAARVAGLDLGFVPADGGLSAKAIADGLADVVYLLGADEIDVKPGSFVIYQGSHGDRGASRADVVLPGATYTEKSATYVNLEGRAQQTLRAAFAPGEAKEDWAIIRAVSAAAGRTLPYDTLPALRAQMYKAAPQLAALDVLEQRAVSGLETLTKVGGTIGDAPIEVPATDFYLTNPIARSSAVLAGMSALRAAADGRHLSAAE